MAKFTYPTITNIVTIENLDNPINYNNICFKHYAHQILKKYEGMPTNKIPTHAIKKELLQLLYNNNSLIGGFYIDIEFEYDILSINIPYNILMENCTECCAERFKDLLL